MIKVYSTPVCPACKQVKEFLSDNEVEFEEVNIAGNLELIRYIKDKVGLAAVPVTEIGGEFVVGFKEAELRQKLNLVK